MKRKQSKHIVHICGACIIILVVFIVLPFIIERIILFETVPLFNLPIYFSKETWFSFIASYLGAVGTIVLGCIALYQNRNYKKLSDSYEEQLMVLQKEIKELTEKSVALIELNTKLEQAKYHPSFTDVGYCCWNISEPDKSFDLINDTFQCTFNTCDPYVIKLPIEDVFKDYYTFVYTLKNDNEHVIRNFHCNSVTTKGQDCRLSTDNLIVQECDIEPGAILRCIYATKYNLADLCSNGNSESLIFSYQMENTLGEQYEMTADIFFYDTFEDSIPGCNISISTTKKQ